MERNDRAELALRIVALAIALFHVKGLLILGPGWVTGNLRGDQHLTGALLQQLLPALAWTAILILARPISSRLFRLDSIDHDSLPQQTLHCGVVLIGSHLLVSLLAVMLAIMLAMTFAVPFWLAAGQALFVVLVPYLLWYPRHLRQVLGWCIRGTDAPRFRSTALLASGITLIGLFYMITSLGRVFTVLGTEYQEHFGPEKFWYFISADVTTILFALLLCAFAGPLASLLMPESQPEEESSRAGRRDYFEIALFVAVLFLLISLSRMHYLRLSYGLRTLVFVVCGILVVVASRWFVPRLTDFFYPDMNSPSGAGRDSAYLLLQAALTLAATYFLVNYFARIVDRMAAAPFFPSLPLDLVVTAVCLLLLLVLRSDLAWWVLGKPEREPEDPKLLTRILRPGFVLIGLLFLLVYLPSAAFVPLAPSLFGESGIAWEQTTLAALGVALVCGAGPLARLMTHGRLLPRIWPHH